MKFYKLLLASTIVLLSIHCNSDDDVAITNKYANCCNTAPVEMDLSPGKIYIPNIFTPNQDGINDLFKIFSDDDVEMIVEYKIFDAESNIIFESENFPTNSNSDKFWAPANDVEEGSYGYTIVVNNINGNLFEYSGSVCLFRCDELHPLEFTNECGFPSQYNGNGSFDPFLPTGEEDCP